MDNSTHRTPLRVGLVGFGMAGAAFHAPLIARTPGLELATVVTGHAARAAAAREEYPDVAVRPDLKDALATQDLDLVVVASPNHVHVEQAALALQAGAHIVIDKPVAPTAAEVRRLERLAEQRELVAAAFHNRRWDSDFLTLRALLDSGRLGRAQRFESRFERWNPVPSRNWRESGDPAKAPGLLYDLGTHLIDQALQLFGPVASVYAESDIRRPGVRAPDDVFVALRHVGGEVSHLWMSKVAADTGPRMRVLGPRPPSWCSASTSRSPTRRHRGSARLNRRCSPAAARRSPSPCSPAATRSSSATSRPRTSPTGCPGPPDGCASATPSAPGSSAGTGATRSPARRVTATG